MTHFCPNCWKILDAYSEHCPDCGFRLADYDAASYERKLLLALRHPVRESRLLAVEILGRIRSRRAIAPFRRMLAANEDYYLLREVLRALAQIGTPHAIGLLEEANATLRGWYATRRGSCWHGQKATPAAKESAPEAAPGSSAFLSKRRAWQQQKRGDPLRPLLCNLARTL